MQNLAARVLFLVAGGFAAAEAVLSAAPLSGNTIDISAINSTVGAATAIVESINTTVGAMAQPLTAAVPDLMKQLGSLKSKVAMAALVSPELGAMATELIATLNTSMVSATDDLPSALSAVQTSLTDALAKFVALADQAYAAFIKANNAVTALSGNGTALLWGVDGGEVSAPKTTKAAPKVVKAVKPHQASSLLETRATQIRGAAGRVSIMDRAFTKKGGGGSGCNGPDASIDCANVTVDQIADALTALNKTASDAFDKLTTAVTDGLAAFSKSAQEALIKAASTSGAAQPLLAPVNSSLQTLISGVQSATSAAASAGGKAVQDQIATAIAGLQPLSDVAAALQAAAAAAANSTSR